MTKKKVCELVYGTVYDMAEALAEAYHGDIDKVPGIIEKAIKKLQKQMEEWPGGE